MLFDGLRVVFGSHNNNKDLQTWAKVEYGKDWKYAYNYMLNNNGHCPKSGGKW